MTRPKAKKILPVLFVTLLLDMVGIGMIIPIIPILFTDATSPHFLLLGYSAQAQLIIAGAITALFGVVQFLAAPVLGELSDLLGRKKLLTLGVGVLALAQLLFGIGIETGMLWLLFVSRAIAGIGSANFSIAQATIADVTPPADRAKNFGLIGAAFGVGFIVGPVLSGWLAGIWNDPALPFWVASGLGILNLVWLSLFLPETHKVDTEKKGVHMLQGIRNIQAALRDVDARPIYLASFLFTSGFAFYTSFSGVFLVSRFGLTEGEIGTYFGVSGLWIVITQMIILRLVTQRYGEKQILFVSFLVLAGTLFLYPFYPSMAFVYGLIPFIAIPIGLSMANMTALISKGVSAGKQGAALGINGSLNALSQGMVPLLAGGLAAVIGVQFLFFIGAFVVLVAWSILFIWMKR